MTYMLWQINDIKSPLPEHIIRAMEHHANKYGKVPNIIEISDRIDKKDIPHFDGVLITQIHVPINILLLACD
jgi:hypothetical protein